MSRSIAESISLLSETLGNCKTNLKEKSVTDVDNIKISDVDEKIAEIQTGGGDELPDLQILEYIKYSSLEIKKSNMNITMREGSFEVKAASDYVYIHYNCDTISCDKTSIPPGETATITLKYTSRDGVYPICFCSEDEFGNHTCDDVLFICCYSNN